VIVEFIWVLLLYGVIKFSQLKVFYNLEFSFSYSGCANNSMYLCLENFSPNSLNHMHFAYFLNYYLHTISIGGDSNPSSPPCKNLVIPLSYKALGYSFISFSIWFYLSISHSLKYGFLAVSCIHWYSSSSHCCNLVFDIRHMLVNPLLLLLLLQTEEGLRLFSNCLCTFSYLPYTFHNHCNVCLLPPHFY
jgi:hypothetical protein